jgi:hypothetical protein
VTAGRGLSSGPSLTAQGDLSARGRIAAGGRRSSGHRRAAARGSAAGDERSARRRLTTTRGLSARRRASACGLRRATAATLSAGIGAPSPAGKWQIGGSIATPASECRRTGENRIQRINSTAGYHVYSPLFDIAQPLPGWQYHMSITAWCAVSGRTTRRWHCRPHRATPRAPAGDAVPENSHVAS